MSKFRRAAAAALFAVVASLTVVSPPAAGPDAPPVAAPASADAQTRPCWPSKPGVCWFGSLGWGSWSLYTDDVGWGSFDTPFTDQDPIDLGAVPLQTGPMPSGGPWVEENWFGAPTSRGWWVTPSTRWLSYPNGQTFDWYPWLDQAGGAGSYVNQYVPPSGALIPEVHWGEFAGTQVTRSPVTGDSKVFYACFFARWCYYGHNPSPAVYGAFIGHAEKWPFKKVQTKLAFTPCTTCEDPSDELQPEPTPPVMSLGGWEYGRTTLGGTQPVNLAVSPLRCDPDGPDGPLAEKDAPCGQGAPKESSLSPSANPPQVWVRGPYINKVVYTYELIAPPGFTEGPNPQVNAYRQVNAPKLTIVAPPGGFLTPQQTKTQADLAFFRATGPGERYLVKVTATVSLSYHRTTWDPLAPAGQRYVVDRNYLAETMEAKVTNSGFRVDAATKLPMFTVVGNSLTP